MSINSDATAAGQHRRFVYYYREPHIVVTSDYVRNAQARYPLDELRVINRVQTFAYPAARVAIVVGAIDLIVGAMLATVYGAPLLFGAGLLSAVVLALAFIIDGRRNPRWMVLQALHRGERVTLLTSRDRREFEQVRFAIIRAIEAHQRVHR